MADEWGPWIEHDGKGCPCVGQLVHVVIMPPVGNPYAEMSEERWEPGFTGLSDDEAIGVAVDDGSWRWHPDWFPIIRYRVRKPRALQQLREMVENLTATAKPVEQGT